LLLVIYRKQLYYTVNNFIIFPQGQKIAEALVGTQVKAVIVSACESGKTASNALASGLAQRLSAQGTRRAQAGQLRLKLLEDCVRFFARIF